MTPADLQSARAQLATLTAAVAPIATQYQAAVQAQLAADSADAQAQAAAAVTAKARATADANAATIKGQLAVAQAAVQAQTAVVSAAVAALVPDYTIIAGTPLWLDGLGVWTTYDFGDAGTPFNNSVPDPTHPGATIPLTAYNAAHVYDTPGDYTVRTRGEGAAAVDVTYLVRVVPDTRPHVPVSTGADLGLLAQKTNTVYDLAGPTASYPMSVGLNVLAGVAIRGHGATVVRSASSSSAFVPAGDDTEISSMTITGVAGTVCVRPRGKRCLIRDVTGGTIGNLVHPEDTADGVLVLNPVTGSGTAQDAIYDAGAKNLVVLGGQIIDSQGEHGIRMEVSSVDSSAPCRYVLIAGTVLSNHDGKETITFRNATWGAVLGVSANAWMRTGNNWLWGKDGKIILDAKTGKPVPTASSIRFVHVLFTGARLGGVWLDLVVGSSPVWAVGCVFPMTDNRQGLVSVNAPGSAILTGNVIVQYPGTAKKALVATSNDAAGLPPVVNETGTQWVQSAAPATQPTTAPATQPAH